MFRRPFSCVQAPCRFESSLFQRIILIGSLLCSILLYPGLPRAPFAGFYPFRSIITLVSSENTQLERKHSIGRWFWRVSGNFRSFPAVFRRKLAKSCQIKVPLILCFPLKFGSKQTNARKQANKCPEPQQVSKSKTQIYIYIYIYVYIYIIYIYIYNIRELPVFPSPSGIR